MYQQRLLEGHVRKSWSYNWQRVVVVIALVAVTMGLMPQSTNAAVTVSVKGTQLNPGQSGFINVFIRSDGLSVDLLDIFGIEVHITPVIGGPALSFTDPAVDPQLIDPNYIFNGNSLATLFPPDRSSQ